MATDLVPRDMPIVGPPRLVREALETQRRQGRLLTRPQDIVVRPAGGGMVSVRVRLLVEQRRPWRKRNPLLFGLLVAMSVLAVMFGIGWLMVRAMVHALTGASDSIGLGFLVIAGALLLAVLANRTNHRGACPGIAVHCKGCKH